MPKVVEKIGKKRLQKLVKKKSKISVKWVKK